jgi:lysophospholipase L1-like esterase
MMLLALLLLSLNATAATNFVILGDSMGAFADDTMQRFCKGKTALNRAISGSLAAEWATVDGIATAVAYSMDEAECGTGCTATEAMKGGIAAEAEVAWLSVGGNDLMPRCASMTATALEEIVAAGVQRIKDTGFTGKVLLTSYCAPTVGFSLPGCTIADLMDRLASAFQGVADADPRVEFIDVRHACGASGAGQTPANGSQMTDKIHLTYAGYCDVWTLPAMQQFLGCEAASYDCRSVAGEHSGESGGPGANEDDEMATEVMVMIAVFGIVVGAILVFACLCRSKKEAPPRV